MQQIELKKEEYKLLEVPCRPSITQTDLAGRFGKSPYNFTPELKIPISPLIP